MFHYSYSLFVNGQIANNEQRITNNTIMKIFPFGTVKGMWIVLKRLLRSYPDDIQENIKAGSLFQSDRAPRSPAIAPR